MRPLRIVALVAAGLIGLIVIGLVLGRACSSTRTTIATISRSMVEEKTGRELTLSGDLKLSVFPWIAIESGPAALGDAPGFAAARSRSSRTQESANRRRACCRC